MSDPYSIAAQYERLCDELDAMNDELIELMKAEKERNKIMFAALKKIVMTKIKNQETAEAVRQVAIDAIFAVRPDLKEQVEGMNESAESKGVR